MRISDWSSDVCSSDLLLPGPVVPDPALGVGEDGIRRGPHRQALVGKNDLDVDAVAPVVFQTHRRVGARLRAPPVLAFEAHDPYAVGPVAQIGRATWCERVCQYV